MRPARPRTPAEECAVSDPLEYLADHAGGIAAGLLVLFASLAAAQWLCWLLGVGRFKRTAEEKPAQYWSYVFSDFFVRMFDNFRNLLAMVIVTMFFVIMLVAAARPLFEGRYEDLRDSLQTVGAVLGPLIGGILGYYFGESAAVRQAARLGETAGVGSAAGGPAGTAAGEGAGAPPILLPGGGAPPEAPASE
jgi:hypothetical protein